MGEKVLEGKKETRKLCADGKTKAARTRRRKQTGALPDRLTVLAFLLKITISSANMPVV